jgi:hypothetical protein
VSEEPLIRKDEIDLAGYEQQKFFLSVRVRRMWALTLG